MLKKRQSLCPPLALSVVQIILNIVVAAFKCIMHCTMRDQRSSVAAIGQWLSFSFLVSKVPSFKSLSKWNIPNMIDYSKHGKCVWVELQERWNKVSKSVRIAYAVFLSNSFFFLYNVQSPFSVSTIQNVVIKPTLNLA